MANTSTENGLAQPYKPSWVDRFTDWVGQLPMPQWLFYTGLGLGLILIQVLFLWLDGGLTKAEVLLPIIIFNGLSIPFLLALTRLLDDQAVTALDTMRPMLDITEPEFDRFQYKLSTMPSWPAFLTGLGLLVFYVLIGLLWTAPVRFTALEQLPIFAIVFHICDKSPAFVFGAFFYHTIRQLRLVNTINSNYVRISLFNLGPSQAFSKLTAYTALGLVFGMYGWMLINPDLLADPISVGFVGAFSILAVAVFAWPLWGVHRLVEREKTRILHEIDLRFEAVFANFDQHLRDEEYGEAERLNATIASLEIQYRRISKIPTWPWRPETARFVLTAIALPLILTILQFFVLQRLDR